MDKQLQFMRVCQNFQVQVSVSQYGTVSVLIRIAASKYRYTAVHRWITTSLPQSSLIVHELIEMVFLLFFISWTTSFRLFTAAAGLSWTGRDQVLRNRYLGTVIFSSQSSWHNYHPSAISTWVQRWISLWQVLWRLGWCIMGCNWYPNRH